MRALLVLSVVLVAAIPVAVLAIGFDAEAPVTKPILSKARVERLEKQVAYLASRIPVLQKMLDDAQAELRHGAPPPAMTPNEAVESFKADPNKAVTVEFGVQPIGVHSGLVRVGDDPDSADDSHLGQLSAGRRHVYGHRARPRLPAACRLSGGDADR